MISVDERRYLCNNTVKFDLSGSNDEPPTGEFEGKIIANGSTYTDWHAGKLYRYDAETQTWELFGGGS